MADGHGEQTLLGTNEAGANITSYERWGPAQITPAVIAGGPSYSLMQSASWRGKQDEMSAKSIKAFQDAYPQHKPRLDVRLKQIAAKMRAKAQSYLAQANELDEIADEFRKAFGPDMMQDEPRCSCGSPLTFNSFASGMTCWCSVCESRSLRDGAVIHVYGHGRDNASALADWRRQQENF